MTEAQYNALIAALNRIAAALDRGKDAPVTVQGGGNGNGPPGGDD